MNFSVLVFLFGVVAFASCQKIYDDGKYRPEYYNDDYYRYRPLTATNRYYTSIDDSYYRPEFYKTSTFNRYRYQPTVVGFNDGRYVHDYSGSDGRYVHDNSGAYKPEIKKITQITPKTEVIVTKTQPEEVKYVKTVPAPVVPFVKTAPIRVPIVKDIPHYRDGRPIAILRLENNQEVDGYQYAYETENGIVAQEQGKVQNVGTDDQLLRTSGFYTYPGPDGVQYTVHYTADENGFRAQGDHLPQAPAVPETLRSVSFKRV